MKLTIVTATYKLVERHQEEMVRRCIESVKALPFEHEHLLMDGASPDGTAALLREIAAGDPTIQVHSEPDTGIYDAFNKGLAKATGDYIYFLGADDYIFDPAAMQAALDKVIAEHADIVVSPIRFRGKNCPKHQSDTYKIFSRMTCNHQGTITRTEMLRKINGFSLVCKIASDHRSTISMLLHGAKLVCNWQHYTEFADGGISCDSRSITVEDDITGMADVYSITLKEARALWADGVFPRRRLSIFNDLNSQSAIRAVRYLMRNLVFCKVHRGRWSVYRIFNIPILILPRVRRHHENI